jgi:hypothetical protein
VYRRTDMVTTEIPSDNGTLSKGDLSVFKLNLDLQIQKNIKIGIFIFLNFLFSPILRIRRNINESTRWRDRPMCSKKIT